MSFIEILLIGIGLSMDAFAVALCKGLSMKKFNIKAGLIIALFFGFFQAFMPFIGWLVCKNFEKYITKFDHWIAFVLLAFIGVKMIIDSIKEMKHPEDSEEEFKLKIGELFVLAIATSIDALAVGISFAFLNIKIWSSITIIGITTFILSLIGILIGNKFGSKFKTKAEIAGGIILVLIGLKILFEHLGLISF